MTRSLLASVLVLLLFSCGEKPETKRLTATEFGDAFVARLVSVDPSLSVTRGEDLVLRIDGGQPNEPSVFLYNAYKEYGQAPEDLDAILDSYVKSALETIHMTTNRMIDIDRIVPVIKDIGWLGEVRQSNIEAGYPVDKLDYYYEKLNDHLLIFYALDTERTINYLGRRDLENLGIAPGDMREHAAKNLNRLLPDIEIDDAGGIFLVTADGNYEASLLLFDSIWTRDNFNVQGEFVATVPSRDVLFVTGSRNLDGLEKLRKLAHTAVQKDGYSLTDQLFVRRDGKWLPFSK
jgi:uncharacterized protein YtpQ (UPF0354 family)